MDGADDRDIRIGSLALKAGLVTQKQLMEALSTQAEEALQGKLARQVGLIFISKGWITADQLGGLLQRQDELRRLP
jgi:arginine repressor